MRIYRKMTIIMAYEVIILYHLHMLWYYVETFTEYLFLLLFTIMALSGNRFSIPFLGIFTKQTPPFQFQYAKQCFPEDRGVHLGSA